MCCPFVLTANRCGLHVLRPLVKRGHDLSEGAQRGYKKLGPKRKTTKPTPRATVCHTCVLLCSRIHSCRHSVAMPVRVGVALIMQTVGLPGVSVDSVHLMFSNRVEVCLCSVTDSFLWFPRCRQLCRRVVRARSWPSLPVSLQGPRLGLQSPGVARRSCSSVGTRLL